MTARRGRWTRVVLAGAVGCLLAVLAAEGLVLVLAGEQPKFPRHVVRAAWGLRTNDPGSRYRHKSSDVQVHFAINGQGMRADEDVAYAKPAGTRRIVCLGDSFTIGYEVEREDCFAEVLQRELRRNGGAVEVLNAGVSGFSTAEECLYLERELHKYRPDVVLISFFENDYADNVRTGLFALSEGRLVETGTEYVPAGRMADFLNTNLLVNLLSQRSNAFAFLKESWTHRIKRAMVEKNRPLASASGVPAKGGSSYEHELCAAILERLHAWTRARGVHLVIQSIPFPAEDDATKLVDRFPEAGFDVDRPGILFFPAKSVLQPVASRGTELLYWRRSHSHWTPLAHRLAGEGLAAAILAANLLAEPAPRSGEPAQASPAQPSVGWSPSTTDE